MTLPNFIVFGTRKAGTTSLYHYLEQHPQVFMSSLKGTRYFHYDPDHPDRGSAIPVKTQEDYESYFEAASAKGAVAIGEASPTYLYDAGAASRIKALLPNVRLIASLRNPIDRAYSQYLMQARNNNGGAWAVPSKQDITSHLSAGLYAEHLQRYYELFSKEQILVLIFEEWTRDIDGMLQHVHRFLNVDEGFKPDLSLQYNKGGIPKNQVLGSLLKHRKSFVKLKPYVPAGLRSAINRIRNANMASAPRLPVELRAECADYFTNDIQELERLLGRDLSIWRDNARRG